MIFAAISRILTVVPSAVPALFQRAPFHFLVGSCQSAAPALQTAGGAWSHIPVRTNIRDNFPRPREQKRIKTHGWLKRLSTPGGRRVLMRRILKGRHVLSH